MEGYDYMLLRGPAALLHDLIVDVRLTVAAERASNTML